MVPRARNIETKVFPNSWDIVDCCVDVLASAGVPMVSHQQAMHLNLLPSSQQPHEY